MKTRKAHEVQHRTAPLAAAKVRVEESGADGIPFAGYASVFNQRTWIGAADRSWGFFEEIAPEAFTKTLSESSERVKLLHNHRSEDVMASVSGGTLELSVDSYGLRAEAVLADTSTGRDVATLIKRGDLGGMSFGFWPVTEETTRLDDGNWLFRVKEAALVEVSTTAFPAYDGTEVDLRSVMSRALRMIPEEDRSAGLLEAAQSLDLAPSRAADQADEGDNKSTEPTPEELTRAAKNNHLAERLRLRGKAFGSEYERAR